MTSLSNNFGDSASGLPGFQIQEMFGKFAGASDGYTPEQNVSYDTAPENAM